MIESVRPHQVFGLLGRGERLASTVVPAPTSVSFSLLEKTVIAALVRYQKPARIFEFGTYEGDATTLLAANAPEAQVHTMDLDEEAVERVALDLNSPVRPDLPGLDYQDRLLFREIGGELGSRIVELKGDSLAFDASPHKGRMDLVLIDANHHSPCVDTDTRNAFEMLASGGMVIWDDYCQAYPDVGACLQSAGLRELELFHIEDTQLVVYGSAPDFAARLRAVRWQR